MRFDLVTAHAFGALRDAHLELRSGLNVVYGGNETGKSTWHAALYAGLCGRRRGHPRKQDREFEKRRRPWSGKEWLVTLRITLADGRSIELRQNLDHLVDCRAIDTVLGHDVSAEILFEGTPDGSQWLGLDRYAFPATACVYQADLLGLLDDPEVLQEHVQRAAATGGRDETAARALALIEEFKREHVGLDRANSRKPLRNAKDALEQARDDLLVAHSEHGTYLALAAESDDAARTSEAAERELRALRAQRARCRAEIARERLARASAIRARFPEGAPQSDARLDEVARRAVEALATWASRPSVFELTGPRSEELRAELEALPQHPTSPTEPAAEVERSGAAFQQATSAVALQAAERPADPLWPETGRHDEAELLRLAEQLEGPEPAPVDPGLSVRRVALRKIVSGSGPLERILLLAGGAVLFAGAVIAFASAELRGAALLIGAAGAVSLVSQLWRRFRALVELRDVESHFGLEAQVAESERTKRAEARARATALGIEPTADSLRATATALHTAAAQQRVQETWRDRHAELEKELERCTARLRTSLLEQDASAGGAPADALASYRSACRERAEQAARAARRPDLEGRIEQREQVEGRARAADAARETAANALGAAAAAAGLTGPVDDALMQSLRDWQSQRRVEQTALEQSRKECAELEALLDGDTLEDLAAQSQRCDELAERLLGDLPREIEISYAELPDAIEDLDAQARVAATRAAELRGQLEQRASGLPSVPDAEEQLERAEEELARVTRLESTLDRTREILEKAQDRVHRDIAPRLASSIRERLPEITNGRYVDVSVDPESLLVRVSDRAGRRIDANLLSHGTAEQVYLLLRLSLASHLVTPGEICPLLLDDITVQSDPDRTRQILELLHGISRDRQVVLFSQEEEVLRWAEQTLIADTDQLVRLDEASVT